MNKQKPLAHSAKKEKHIPSQTYAEHITGVVKRAENNISAISAYISGNSQLLAHTIRCAAYLHDLGKLDQSNQEALKHGGKKSLPVNHVDAGTTWLLREIKNQEAALLVYGHHIGLCSIPEEALRKELFFRDERICKYTDSQLVKYIAEHKQLCRDIDNLTAPSKTGWSALTRRLLFSCLVDADYGDSAENDCKENFSNRILLHWEERLSKLDAYVDSLAKSVNNSRISQRQEVYRICKNVDVKPSIYACDSPVGTGKTTAVMAHLLRVAKEKKLRHVFVILPYTNIIKQSVDVYRGALVLPDEKPEEIVAELHHQADFSSENLRQYAVLWTAPIIVTTAVQFFETLAGNYPGRLRKLHELPGSAIFIDEAHSAIPSYMWPQAWQWLRELRQKWGCQVVLASGSLPQLWSNNRITVHHEDVLSLLDKNTYNLVCVGEQKRIIYKTEKKAMSIPALIGLIMSKPGPRLVILNTVQSAAVLAHKMKEKDLQVMHLSTALTPHDRERVIKKIKRCLMNKRNTDWTLVATSCVEAGMDFSFATAFRESCSAASLIQVGGRVNRHGENTNAEVWDFIVNDSMLLDNSQLITSCNVLRVLFEEKYFENRTPTQIVTKALELELMSDFGNFADRSQEIIKQERQNDFPAVAKLCKVIESDMRTVIISENIVNAIESYEKVNAIDLIRNSVQIRTFKIKSKEFEKLCIPLASSDELYSWRGKYDGKFLGYMEAIIPLLEIDKDGFRMV